MPDLMEKGEILALILAELDNEIRRLQEANRNASAGATDSESRAESQWDTLGLEFSYLARGYAQQFALLSEQAKRLRAFKPSSYAGKAIGPGALLECELDGETSLMFFLPCCGGLELVLEGRELTVVTPDSPLGRTLMYKREGDAYALPGGAKGTIIRVE